MKEGSARVASGKDMATLGGGCFWCLEAVYERMVGVESVKSGYMGGQSVDPSYEEVCMGQTGHAEVVQIIYSPTLVSYRDLLQVFFAIHDPTTLNRQGNDVGTQYRSAIFYHSPEQQKIAADLVAELTSKEIFSLPIVTQIVPATTFYVAESYHQEYFTRNPSQPYCAYVVGPKIAKFRKQFADKLKGELST
jgi:peptide-methionine (S)-S-oxide reductase